MNRLISSGGLMPAVRIFMNEMLTATIHDHRTQNLSAFTPDQIYQNPTRRAAPILRHSCVVVRYQIVILPENAGKSGLLQISLPCSNKKI